MINRLRVAACSRSIQSIEINQDRFMLQRNGEYILLQGGKFPRLSSRHPADKLSEAAELLKSL